MQVIELNSKKKRKKDLMRKAVSNPLLVRRALNDKSLYEFVKWGWAEVSPDDYEDNWHIPFMCKPLEKLAKRVGKNKAKKHDLIFNVPPGTSKTRVVSVLFQVWCWTKWYWFNFITASHASPLSIENADLARDLIKSEKFKQIYPELYIRADKDSKTNFKIVKIIGYKKNGKPIVRNGGSRYSTSVKGMGIGLHAHIQICDDLINPKEALSKNALDTANHFLDHTLSGRKTNKKVTPLILIMQRLSEEDPTKHLLDKKGKKIKHFCLPGEIREYKKYLKPKSAEKYYIDDLLDPKRLGWKVLRELESDLGQYGYAGQIGQHPTPPEGGMFKVNNFDIAHIPFNPRSVIKTVRSWDKAGTTEAGAFTVGVKMSYLTGGRIVIEDIIRGQWSSDKRERIIKRTTYNDGHNVKVIVEQEPGSGGKESAQATVRNLIGYTVVIDRPVGDKILRADPLSVQVNNGNVILMKGKWNKEYIKEFRLFPFKKLKDQVDATTAGFNYLVQKKEVRRII